MKKLFSVILIIASILALSSCAFLFGGNYTTPSLFSKKYDFMYSEEEISRVSLVALRFKSTGGLVQSVVLTVDDTESFLSSFKKIDCDEMDYKCDVAIEGKDDLVFKIEYKNGDFELINHCGQACYTSTSGFVRNYGSFILDETEFENLISRYAPQE